MKNSIFLISIISVVSIFSESCTATDFENGVIIEHVALVDPVRDELHNDMSIIIEKGRVLAIGPSSLMHAPRDMQHIDGAGRYVLPGLVDAHMHLGDSPDDLLIYLSYGVTSVRSLDGSPDHVKWRDEVIAGDLVGPTIYTSGPISYGEESKWAETTDTAAAARAIVAEHIAIGYDYLKVYYQLNNAKYKALIVAARETGLPIVGHVPWSQSVEDILNAGQLTNEHLSGFDVDLQESDSPVTNVHTAWGNMLRYLHDDESLIEDMARLVSNRKHWNIPTLIDYEIVTRPSEVDQLLGDDKFMGLLSAKLRKQWSSYNRWQIPRMSDFTDEDREVMRNAVQDRREFVKALHDAGAGIAAGTDAGGGRFIFPGLSLHKELEIFVELGMTEAEALKTATINAAVALVDEQDFGVIAPGLRADLIMVNSNPLEDITATQEIEGVMARGRWYTRGDLESLLADVRDRRSRP